MTAPSDGSSSQNWRLVFARKLPRFLQRGVAREICLDLLTDFGERVVEICDVGDEDLRLSIAVYGADSRCFGFNFDDTGNEAAPCQEVTVCILMSEPD